MLNDVSPPPMGGDSPADKPARHAALPRTPHERDRHDRAHDLERAAGHSGGHDVVFDEPEDRGDSFNTTMSAVIVGGVLIALLVVAWTIWR